jgi:Pyruvate/2-oxoacid:ferredoxin oxidoreductase gamma subunit
MVDAVRHPGFALLDIWDLCTAYFVPKNKLGKRGLEQTIGDLGLAKGVLYQRETKEYAAAYREAAATMGKRRAPAPLPTEFTSSLEGTLSVVVAGSAGAKVRSAARLLGEAAIRSGLWATLRGDYPVTVKSGHSVSQLVLSRDEMPPVAVTNPDVMVLASEDGLSKVEAMLAAMGPEHLVVTVPAFAGLTTGAKVMVIDPAEWERRLTRTQLALMLLAAATARTGVVSADAFRAAAAGPFAADNLNAVEAGVALASRQSP